MIAHPICYKIAVALTALVQFLSPLNSGAEVLCVEVDGHISRETAINGMCETDWVAHESRALDPEGDVALSSPHSEQCGQCTDVAILSTIEGTGIRSRESFEQPKVWASFLQSDVFVSGESSNFVIGYARSPIGLPSSKFLRSVSLRI